MLPFFIHKNKSPRNPRSTRFPRLFHNRGWENRTPAKSFGDSCHTIWPIPFILLFLFLFSFLVDDPPATLGNTLFIPYRHSFVNRLSVSLLYKRKWLHRHSLFSVPSKLHTFKSFLEIRLPVLEFLFLLLSPLSPALGQALDRLVAVSSIRYRTSTSVLSTSSSSRGLTAFAWDISSRGGLHA